MIKNKSKPLEMWSDERTLRQIINIAAKLYQQVQDFGIFFHSFVFNVLQGSCIDNCPPTKMFTLSNCGA